MDLAQDSLAKFVTMACSKLNIIFAHIFVDLVTVEWQMSAYSSLLCHYLLLIVKIVVTHRLFAIYF